MTAVVLYVVETCSSWKFSRFCCSHVGAIWVFSRVKIAVPYNRRQLLVRHPPGPGGHEQGSFPCPG